VHVESGQPDEIVAALHAGLQKRADAGLLRVPRDLELVVILFLFLKSLRKCVVESVNMNVILKSGVRGCVIDFQNVKAFLNVYVSKL